MAMYWHYFLLTPVMQGCGYSRFTEASASGKRQPSLTLFLVDNASFQTIVNLCMALGFLVRHFQYNTCLYPFISL